MIKTALRLSLALSIIGMTIPGWAVHEYEEQLQNAAQFPIIQTALKNDKESKEKAIEDMSALSAFIQKNGTTVDVDSLLEKVKTRLEQEKQNLDSLSATLKPLAAGSHVTWSLKTNKMALAIDDLLANYVTAPNLSTLLSGDHMFDMSLTEESFPAVLGKGFWGTTQGTRYELFLTAVAAELMDAAGKSPVPGFSALEAAGINIDESPIAHIVPLPTQSSDLKELTTSLFFVPDYLEGQPGFLQTHTGFLFGGHRNVDEGSSLEPRYPHGKRFGPEDCSSSVGKICGYNHVIATLYQWMFWKESFDKESYESILGQIAAEPAADIRKKMLELGSHFEAIDPKDVQPGDVFGWRTQSEGKPLGIGGHTGIFIGTAANSNPLILGPNRGLPETQMDGFGLEEREMKDTFEKFAMRLKK